MFFVLLKSLLHQLHPHPLPTSRQAPLSPAYRQAGVKGEENRRKSMDVFTLEEIRI